MQDVLSAVMDWLDGLALEELYRRHEFVEKQRRALVSLEARILELCPALQRSGSHTVKRTYCDLHELWFSDTDRSMKISYGEGVLDADFFWDDCQMFSAPGRDADGVAGLIDQWLIGRTNPSAIQVSYPDLVVEPVARFYEEGRPIEGEFLLSWDSIESFYGVIHLDVALALIKIIQRAGFDRDLRAGQSMSTLILSRSRRHGLRDSQPFIAFSFERTHIGVRVRLEQERVWSMSDPELTPQLLDALERLRSCAID